MLYYSREDTDTTTRSMSAEIPCISCTVACKTFFDMCELTKGISDDSSYQSLQSLNSFDSVYDANAGREVEEIMKRKVNRDSLYRYQTCEI